MARKAKTSIHTSARKQSTQATNRREVDQGYRTISAQSLGSIAHKITGLKGRLRNVNSKFNEILRYEADTLCWIGGQLVHIEIQAQNDPDILYRMGSYGFHALHQEGVLPNQYVIYVGEKPLKMPQTASNTQNKLGIEITFIQPRYEWDAHEFLSSNIPEKIIWAIFCGGLSKNKLIKAVFEKINGLKITKTAKNEYFRAIELLTNNTSLQPIVAKYMKIYGIEVDITKDRYYKAGKDEGRDAGKIAERIKLVNGMRRKGMNNEKIRAF